MDKKYINSENDKLLDEFDNVSEELLKSTFNLKKIKEKKIKFFSKKKIYRSKNNIVEDFFEDICKTKLLTPLKEKVLLQQLKDKDPKIVAKAKEILLNSNIRLVLSIGRRYFYLKGIENNFLDMIFSGIEGISTTLKKFDISKDTKFTTYCHYWIRQKIRREKLVSNSDLRTPVHHSENQNKIFQFIRKYISQHSKAPSLDFLMKKFNLNYKKVYFLLNLKTSFISFNTNMSNSANNNNSHTINNIIVSQYSDRNPYTSFLKEEKIKTMKNIIDEQIDSRTKEIFIKRYGFNINIKNKNSVKLIYRESKTLSAIGNNHNITTERVRQLNAKGLNKLRKILIDKRLQDILKLDQ